MQVKDLLLHIASMLVQLTMLLQVFEYLGRVDSPSVQSGTLDINVVNPHELLERMAEDLK